MHEHGEHGRIRAEGYPVREDLEDHDAEGIEVAAKVDAAAANLLRAHVLGGALDHPLPGGAALGHRVGLGDAEVHDPRVPEGSTMMFAGFRSRNHPRFVNGGQPLPDLEDESVGTVPARGSFASRTCRRSWPGTELHGDELELAVLAEIVDGAHVPVVDLAREPDLLADAASGLLVRGGGAHDLDGHLLLELPVPGFEDLAHAGDAQLADDLVATGQEGAFLEATGRGHESCTKIRSRATRIKGGCRA